MPYRKTILATNEIYHIVNRSVAQVPIFKSTRNYGRFLETISYYQYNNPPLSFSHYKRLPKESKKTFIKNLKRREKIIDIIAFCIMPNHYHFLLKQKRKKGISDFMRNLQNSYARFFNKKYSRSGGVFQSMFKAVRVETDEQLLHVSRYIHLNPSSSHLVEIEDLKTYPWSSLPIYLGEKGYKFVKPKIVLSFFKSRVDYGKFIFNQAKYQRDLQKIKHLILEN